MTNPHDQQTLARYCIVPLPSDLLSYLHNTRIANPPERGLVCNVRLRTQPWITKENPMTKEITAMKPVEGDDTNLPSLLNADGAVAFTDDFFDGETGLEDVNKDDITLGRITVLQGLSPQVNRRKDEYVEGAEQGMLFNTATKHVADEMMVVVAAYERRYIEWTPREKPCPVDNLPKPVGGGLYRDYGTDGEILKECVRWEENGSLWTPRGNELVITGTYYVIDPMTLTRAFIAMGKTQLTPSKKLMAAISDEKIRTRDGIRQAPIFYRAWMLGSTIREVGENSWFVFNHKQGPRLQEFTHGKSVLEEVRKFRDEIMEGAAIIDVTIGETDGQTGKVDPDTARM